VSILTRAAELQAHGVPFVLASVTWVRGPSSGKGGSKAIIHADGTVEGWLGGACAQPTVVAQALETLADGESRLLMLGLEDDRPGVTAVSMACSSEGAMEVFVEPMLPVPIVHIIGDSPMTAALAQMVEALGWSARLHDTEHFEGVGPRDFVVIATQGHYDEPALETALAGPAAYIGLVASEKRASSVRAWLRERGVTDGDLARLHAPAGVDLGKTEHVEIAVAVLAELVAFRASGAGAPVVEVPEPAELATDPVCGMTVDPTTAHFSTDHDGTTYYFCAAGCQTAFEKTPEAFLGS
jgi:xanthine dehydrogenase accessory factor